MSAISSKFDPKKFRELIVESIIKHDLPFQYVEYEGVRESMQYFYVLVSNLYLETLLRLTCVRYMQVKNKRLKLC
jgi:hypothetical protein